MRWANFEKTITTRENTCTPIPLFKEPLKFVTHRHNFRRLQVLRVIRVLHYNHHIFQFRLSFPILYHLNPAYLFPFQLSPSATLHTNRGVIHQFMGDVTSAMEDYQRATTLDPHYFLAHFNAGNILFHQKLFKQVWVGRCGNLPKPVWWEVWVELHGWESVC